MKLSKSWQSHMQTTQIRQLCNQDSLRTTRRHVPTAILSLKPSHQISNATGVHKYAISYTLTIHPICFTNRCGVAISGSFLHPAALALQASPRKSQHCCVTGNFEIKMFNRHNMQRRVPFCQKLCCIIIHVQQKSPSFPEVSAPSERTA